MAGFYCAHFDGCGEEIFCGPIGTKGRRTVASLLHAAINLPYVEVGHHRHRHASCSA